MLNLLVITLLPLACSDAPQWTGLVETRDGIEVIANPGDPLLDEAQEFVTDLWAVQGPTWENPSLVHAGSGLITVVDPQANRVHVVTISGETRESLGRSGGGPGEFLRIQNAFPEGDRFVVLDGGKQGVEYLDLDGDYLSSMHLGRWISGGFPLEDGELLVKGEFVADPAEESTGAWVRVSEGSEPSPFNPQPLDLLPEEQGVQCSDLFSWAGGAARLRFTTPQIQVFNRAGGVLRESRIDLPVEAVSETERDLALAELARRLADRGVPPAFQQQSLLVMEERWRVKCRFGSLEFDPSGRLAAILEQNPDDFGSGNATLHFLSQDGVYLAKVSFPGPWRDFTLDDGVVYALTRDPTTDLITLRAYRVDLPHSVFTDAAEVLEEARRRATEEFSG
jgi:hypothetical protein